MKKHAAIFMALVFIPAMAHAGALSITEIMYDLPGGDTGREWIEVKNTGTTSADLSSWKLFEANTNHKISAIAASNIAPGEYAVIADDSDKFKTDNASYTGLLFDSAFSLSNTGETISLRDESGNDIDTVTYNPSLGASGDGSSLQKTDAGSWIASLPTPGKENSQVAILPVPDLSQGTTTNSANAPSSSSASSGTDIYSSYSSQETVSQSPDEPALEVTAGRPRLGFVNSPLQFQAKVKTIKSQGSGLNVNHIWSMGDGALLAGQNIMHSYSFPGDYMVILNSDLGNAHAVSKVDVRIVESHAFVSNIAPDFIEITNPDDFEVNLGGYRLENNRGKFTIPADTIMPARSKLKLPYINTKLMFGGTVNLFDPSGVQHGSSFSEVSPSISLPLGFDESVLRERLRASLEANER